MPLLSCAVFCSFARLRCENKAALGKAEGCPGRGSPSSCCSAVSSAVPEPWRARLGSVGQNKAYVWAGDGLVPAPAVVDCLSAIPSPAAGTASLTSHVSPTSWNNLGLIYRQQNSIFPAWLEAFRRADVAAAARPGAGVSWRRRCSTSAA